jgi:hypothetical protein
MIRDNEKEALKVVSKLADKYWDLREQGIFFILEYDGYAFCIKFMDFVLYSSENTILVHKDKECSMYKFCKEELKKCIKTFNEITV